LRSNVRGWALPLVLLLAAIVTTTANGARFMQNFVDGMPPLARDSDLWPWVWLWRHPSRFTTGFGFSFTLLAILLIHEFGHYFACRAHGIRCTLPWVLPAPTLSGTAGAVIRLRSPFRTRDALMDVGIFGPLAGYVASVIVIAVGFLLSAPRPAHAPQPIVRFGGDPLTIRLLHAALAHWRPSLPPFDQLSPHPILVAGWIGLFITAFNLIPGAQLDGGHILYALWPRAHRFFTLILPFALFFAGAIYWVGWLLWGIFLLLPFMHHPQIPPDPHLSRSRVVLGVIGILLFVLTFTPTPFYQSSLLHFVR
jgi:membrane-associated protease RseP (regulator of RpoE activity)